MSLRAFHLFFIVASMLLSGFLAVWAVRTSSYPYLAFAGVSGVGLTVYLVWFLKTYKGRIS